VALRDEAEARDAVKLAAATSSSLKWDALPPLWVVVLILLPAVVLLVRFFYRREAGGVGRRPRMAMGVLRICAVLLVLAALFGPYAETVEGEYAKRHLVLCIDTSRSMGFRDGYASGGELADRLREILGLPAGAPLETRSRLDVAKALLSDRAFLEELARKFRLQVYAFDAETLGLFAQREDEAPGQAADRILEALPGVAAEGSVTRLGSAIRDLTRRLDRRNEPVAGIVLFTDGRHTGGAPGPIEEARRAAEQTREGIPIFAVAIGDPGSAVNIGVSRLDAPEVVLAGDDVSFTASVHARGLDGRSAMLEAWLLDAEGKDVERLPIDAEPFTLPAEAEEGVKVTFRHRFEEPGTYLLRIGVPPVPGEAIVDDNWQRHDLSVVKLKMNVLAVSGMPDYTQRYLWPALERASDVIAAQMLLLSAEPDWPQPASRGLDALASFPQDRVSLAKYDVVILSDVDPLDPRMSPGGRESAKEVLGLLEAWVKEGGGLVLQAGRDGHIPSAYRDTPLMGVLPVVPDDLLVGERRDRIVELAKEKWYKLTPAGAWHPVMRVPQDPERVSEFWDGTEYATSFFWYVPVERAKSSATVLAVRRDQRPPEEPHPLVAIQDYGLGKVLWIASDELWRLRKGSEFLYWRFWSNAIRHLATYRLLGGNKRIKIWVDRADGRYRIEDTVGVEAKFLDENFEPLAPDPSDPNTATRTIKLVAPDGTEEPLALHAVPTDPPEGLFRTKLEARRPGTWRLVAETGTDEEPAKGTFVVEDTTIETRNPLMDMRTLTEVAKASRGRVLAPPQFKDLLDDEIVPPTTVIRTGEPKRTDLWDKGYVLWLFVALLALEWTLRRLHLLL
jgi:uncharacterized membrane protein